MTRVLVTGATGFVGRTFCEVLSQAGHTVRAALRAARPMPAGVSEAAIVGDIGAQTDWRAALLGVDLVVHLAARAHVIHDSPANAALYYETNAEGTRRLAESAAEASVGRFVYLSSVKVNGEATLDKPYTAADEPFPQDDYGKSKWLAEQRLAQLAGRNGMATVIVRSPLVYGPGVRANFLRLMRIVDKEWPLPLGAVENERSMVSIWNLCDFLATVSSHPAAQNRTWMVSDGDDLSTPELIRRIGRAMGRRVRLLPIPAALLKLMGRLAGQKAEMDRLCGSLAVDVTQTRRELGWSPLLTVDEGIARTVQWYTSERASQ
jgi:nucleoside-diphosphate-sugar epimerase